jgi:hypothetical protein
MPPDPTDARLRTGMLEALTEQADGVHRQAMTTVHRDLEVAHFGVADPERVASRRGFLTRLGGVAVAFGASTVSIGAMAAAVGAQPMDGGTMGEGSPDGGADAGPGCASGPVEMTAGDETIVRFAASVELAAVAAYELGIGGRRLDAAATQSARVFAGHHADHAEALRCLVGDAPGDPNAALVAALAPQIEGAASEAEVVAVFRSIEAGAAATYYAALGELATPAVAGAASTILPVEAQHEVVWAQVLGEPITEYVPAFQQAEGAFTP